MFYDLDILNRRGGKFGIIWLAAHKKLRLRPRSADFQMMLRVNVARICEEIQRYVRVSVHPQAQEKESPRFSLYLAAMLTHGAILVHHEQVRHDIGNIETVFIKKAAEQTGQKISINRKERNTNAQMIDKDALAVEIDFGNLATGIDFERASIRMPSPTPCRPSIRGDDVLAAQPMDVLLTADMIGEDFTDLDASFSETMTLPHLTTTERITLKEIEPLPRLQDIADAEGPDENLAIIPPDDGFFLEPLPPIVIDEVELPELLPTENGRESRTSLQRTPSKRGRETPPPATPSKRRHDEGILIDERPNAVSTPMGAASPHLLSPIAAQTEGAVPMEVDQPIVDPNPVPPLNLVEMVEMVLEPLAEQPARRQRRNNQRARRLAIDRHIFISNEDFIRQKNEFTNTLRAENHVSDHIRIQPEGYSAQSLLNQPGRKLHSKSLKDLVTRNMTTRPVENLAVSPEPPAIDEWPREENERPADVATNAPEVDVGEIPHGIVLQPMDLPLFEMDAAMNDLPLDMQSLSADVAAHDETVPDQEELRLNSMQSRDPSLAMSGLGTSRIDLSSSDGSRLGAQPTPEKLPVLATLKEASMEVSRATTDARISSIDTSAAAPLPPLQVPMVDLPLPDAMSPTAKHASPSHVAKKSSVPFRIELSPIPSSHSSTRDAIPEGPELLEVIKGALEEEGAGRLTFRSLCPPTRNTKMQAAKLFDNLLWLRKAEQISLDQEKAYGDIYIDMQLLKL